MDRSSIPPFESYIDGDYYIYRVQQEVIDTLVFESDTLFTIDTLDSYYSNVYLKLKVKAAIGDPSPNIFDFDSDGLVDIDDLLNILDGYGSVYDTDYDINQISILFQQSSGWTCTHPDWDVLFVKVTPIDEVGETPYIPNTLNSYFLEGEKDGFMRKVWYYRVGD